MDVGIEGEMARTSWLLADDLLEIAKADTAFADLYLQRARELLPSQLINRTSIRKIAERVYGFDEVLVDPFSPGIHGLAEVPERDLPALRDSAVTRLEGLRAADPAWADLYDARRRALRDVRFAFSAATGGDPGARPPLPLPVLARPFTRDVCDRANKLGLAPYRVESTFEELRARFRPSWRVALGDPGNTVRFSVTVPGDTDEALRDTLALFSNRAFLSSAGTRYVPWCVAEDLLVEDFDEPSRGEAAAPSRLVAALGLSGRSGLARSKLEKALRERGATIVKDLGLDPREYRIVCLPADVYTRLGAKLGWGRQEIWTHFDGYMASADRKLMPLAGGDVRFGGLHDLIAIGCNYDSDRLLARFAIVQRTRFAAW